MAKRPPMPTEDRKPAWRAACIAYRDKRRASAGDHEAYCAAVTALQEVSPGLTPKEVTNAISHASTHHSAWFWSGAGSE
jgi:hypothetical protein